MIKYSIRGENIEVTDSIRNYVESKLGKIEKYFYAEQTLDARVNLKVYREKTAKVEVTILLVDIRNYLGKQINIYHDDFTSDEGAVYTYDYIPPQCIKVYDTFEIS